MPIRRRVELRLKAKEMMGSAERYRQNADDCRQRSLQARTPADKANWLKIAEEWKSLRKRSMPPS